jgi:hypothetical protein
MSPTARRWFALGVPGLMVAAAPSSSPTSAGDVIAHLELTISWYRHVMAEQDSASGPSDVLLRDSTHQASTTALQLAFDFARAETALVSETLESPNASALGPGGGSGNLQQSLAKAAERVNGLVSRIADLDAKIPKSAGRSRTDLTAQRKELQVELDLAKEIQGTLQNLVNFSGSAGMVTGGLSGRIEELERSIPEARHESPGSKSKGSSPSSPTAALVAGVGQPAPLRAFQPDAAGIVALAAELFSIHGSRQRIQDLIQETDALEANIDRLRMPLVNEARNSINRGDQIAQAAPSQSPRATGRRAEGAERVGDPFQATLSRRPAAGRAGHHGWRRSRQSAGIGRGL